MESLGKHVLILVENLPVPFDRRVWMEATTLQEAGYRVSVICPIGKGYESEEEIIDGVHVYRHKLPPEAHRALGYFREYAGALREERRLARKVWKRDPFDIIHLCNPPDLLYLVARPFKRKYGVRVIFDQHDINPELWEAKYRKRGPFYWALRYVEKRTFDIADVVISTNESYREIALTRGMKNSADVFVVRSGPRLDQFRATEGDVGYRRGRRHLVGYVGVMGQQEGIDHLLKAIRRIVDEGRTDIHFMLIGGGPSIPELQAMQVDLGLQDHVEFTGRVSDEELIERLSTCDLCVNPDPKTPFNDKSTMNKVLEYMALGKPVVQYDLTEGRRSAGDASLYANPTSIDDLAAKILELVDDPEQRATMGAKGRERMTRELEWKYQRPVLLEAYARALGV